MIPCYEGVPSSGPPSDVMIIGYMPGYEEMRLKQPFVGPTGSMLHSLLDTLYNGNVYLCNYLCKDDCQCGPRHLQEHIAYCKPKLIVGLGDDVNTLFSDRKLTANRGQPFYDGQRWIMIINQPAAVLHLKNDSPDVAQNIFCDLVRDISKFKDIVGWNPPLTYIHHKVISSLDEAQSVLNNLGDLVALDIETRSVETEQDDAYTDELDCYCVYDGTIPYVLTGDACNAILPDRRWLFHNGMFDTSCLIRFLGQKLPISEDTMLMSYALDERPGHHALKMLAREYLGAGHWEEGKRENLFLYNAFDAYYTFALYHYFLPRLAADGVMSLYKDILLPGTNMYRDSYVHGMAIDSNILCTIMLDWIPRMNKMRAELEQEAVQLGWEGKINLDSPKQLSKLFYEILGLKGGPSTDVAHLEKLGHPYAQRILDNRHLTKMVRDFGLGVYNKVKGDGLLHPHPGLIRTKNGRASYVDPNIQQIPQDYSVGELAILRKMYVPSKPDYVLMEADHSQIEIWMGAALSQDGAMLSDLTEPFDEHGANWHSRIAVEMLDADPHGPKDKWNLARFTSKKVTFGVMYLIGPASLAKPRTGINSTVATAKNYIDRWYNKYHVFRAWQKSTIEEAYDQGEIQTPFGNKRRLHSIISSRIEPEIANFKLSGSASHWTLCSAIELNHMLPQFDASILALVHDSILMEVPAYNVNQVATLVKTVMEKPKIRDFPSVPVELKVGKNWFEMERWWI